MKFLTYLIALTLAIFNFSANAAEIYQFDPAHTYAIWRVGHFGFSNISGKLSAEGTIYLNNTNVSQSKVFVTLHLTDITTADSNLDKVLMGPKFFNVARFPTGTFVSVRIILTNDHAGKIYGILTLKGISRPVVLRAYLNRMGIHPYYHRKALGFSAFTVIKRSDFNLGLYQPGISNEVQIEIQAEALKK